MAIKGLNPYLIFDGTAEKAMKLYESALGATAEAVSRYGDVPGAKMEGPHANRIVHALLRVGGGTVMISDAQPGDTTPAGANVQIALDFDDPADMAKCFEAMSVGGTVNAPIQKMFWDAQFGMVTDAFGISWMFNCPTKKD